MQQLIKRLMVDQVRAVFNDQARGERPVQRRVGGLFGPDSVTWRVHGDVTTMMVGGVAALLLQMLHPAVLAGVWDHSGFRHDMLGRLRRTARFIAVTTYGSREEAEQAIARVRRVHEQVRGNLPDGTDYAATDPHLLGWVHATETTCFLDAWKRYAQPAMPVHQQDRYFLETAQIAERLGATDVPWLRGEMATLIQQMRPELRVDHRTREVSALLLKQRPGNIAARLPYELVMQAAVDLLPPWARRMHGIRATAAPLVRGGTLGLAQTLRWAFR
jgi:uncharacterized protein (DUF2236 family)